MVSFCGASPGSKQLFAAACGASLLGQGDVRQVSVSGQRDVILPASRPPGRRPESKLRPPLRGGDLAERE